MSDPILNFLCPITHALMIDPVIDPNGNSYDRSAIENWLKEHSTSPVTNTPLTLDDLQPNLALRASIENYRSQQSSSDNVSETNTVAWNSGEQSFELTVTSSWINDYAHISIQPPEGIGIRPPCDICCVVDISGSMGTEVEIQSAHAKERCGLSILDLVKHALKTIIYSLTQNDRLSIVSFSDNASILFGLQPMDEDGRSSALAELENLAPDASTNLWGGLKGGLDVLTKGQRASGSNVALFILTDGCPNIKPPEGHLPALAAYKAKTNFTCSINTFGFGYSLESKLLEDLSHAGNSGSYAFIPDGSFVGTIFVNAISNLLTTAATNLKLSIGGIQPPIDPSSEYICNYSIEKSNQKTLKESGLCLNLGSVTFGQSRDVVIPMSKDQYKKLDIILDYQSPQGQKNKQCKSITKLDGDIKLLNQQKHRLEFVYFVRKGYEFLLGGGQPMSADNKQTSGLNLGYLVSKGRELFGGGEKTSTSNPRTALDHIQLLEETIRKDSTDDSYLTDLLTDLTGQVKEALSRDDWFKKWGMHYLLSITRAHLLQQCNNFKDPGVQHYGKGELFNSVRDEMDTIFCGLPAPNPSRYSAPSYSSTSHNQNPAPPIDMSMFNQSDNPCFHGSCTVTLFDGSIKLVKDIRRGDRLYPHGGTVNYVLRTICNNRQAQMVLFDSGLVITAWHPIRLNGVEWILPCSVVPSPTNIICEAVYSFALSEGHTMWINDIECVTLGHGFKEDIVRHAYYGSERVIEDLRIMDGEQNCTGFIEIEPRWVMRNKRTGLVNGIRQAQIVDIISDQ